MEKRLKEEQCKICRTIYKTATGNTSNLIYHIKSKHRGSPEEKELTKELDDEKKEETKKKIKKKEVNKSKTSLLNIVSRSGAIDSKKRENITDSIVEFVVRLGLRVWHQS